MDRGRKLAMSDAEQKADVDAAMDKAIRAMHEHPLGCGAAIIGHVSETKDNMVELRTTAGGSRVVQKPYGEQLPRIC